MEVGSREIDGIAVLDLRGRLTAGPHAAALRESILALSKADKSRVVLNMSHLDYVDSSGLGTLVLCFTGLQHQGGSLKLTNLSKRQMELMVLTKLTTIFEVFDNEQDAVNSFFPERAIKKFDILEYVRANARG